MLDMYVRGIAEYEQILKKYLNILINRQHSAESIHLMKMHRGIIEIMIFDGVKV